MWGFSSSLDASARRAAGSGSRVVDFAMACCAAAIAMVIAVALASF